MVVKLGRYPVIVASMSANPPPTNLLGTYLRDRRSKLDPSAFGFSAKRRRTTGLRREEVAQRANISAAWYTWLEQGRGGAPSSEVLDRLARALVLTEGEREHLFLLGLGRTPEVRYQEHEGVTNRLQRVLDTLDPSPAFIRTATWDVIAWNKAATVVFTDYAALPPHKRNILRLIFLDPRVRTVQSDWARVAEFVVGAFRADVARAGAAEAVSDLVNELSSLSPEFEALWRSNDVNTPGEGSKHIRHPIHGSFAFEYTTFAVDGRQDLSMMVYTPTAPEDMEKIRSIIAAQVAQE